MTIWKDGRRGGYNISVWLCQFCRWYVFLRTAWIKLNTPTCHSIILICTKADVIISSRDINPKIRSLWFIWHCLISGITALSFCGQIGQHFSLYSTIMKRKINLFLEEKMSQKICMYVLEKEIVSIIAFRISQYFCYYWC